MIGNRRGTLYVWLGVAVSGLATSAVPVRASDPTATERVGRGSSDFAVEFTSCVESIGVTLAPTASARRLVPAEFTLAGEAEPVTPIVVRTARCRGIAVDGVASHGGAVVQVGAVIVPPDFTADIDNYTFWYYTNNRSLARALSRAGVPAQFVPTLVYATRPRPEEESAFLVAVPPPGRPSLALHGRVTPTEIAAGRFVANWWSKARRAVKMQTTVPVIAIGSANLSLHTPDGGALGRLLGTATAGFPVLQQLNLFADARMEVVIERGGAASHPPETPPLASPE